ncbi:TetR/AcrR family transcriptional regulator [Streptacidiphilus sp. MAP12-20]|uniref:TetR/AcrR family transcriptional regulator n=1 Tax=Streptacidiphilus sp. MAP12-20 TaxID=3156299 RepID=UPI0035110503
MAGEVREPQQARSREKYARILATTARLLETTPYDELGTKLIAAEAGVSVGVLYRFFPDKEAIVDSLVRGWLDRDLAIVAEATSAPVPSKPRELVERLLAAYAERFRAEPGYRKVWFEGPWVAGPAGRETNRFIAERIHAVLVAEYGVPDDESRRRRSWLAVETGSYLLGLAFREDPEGDPVLLREAVRMIEVYLLAPED